MEDELRNGDDDGAPGLGDEFRPARFSADLRLPIANSDCLKSAAFAVRQEYHDCSKWKRLHCKKVSIFAERDRGTVCVVHVGSAVDFDWTWEGAVAFCPKSLDSKDPHARFSYEDAAFDDEILWKGEVLEVDERNGCLFLSMDDPEALPSTGDFYVRPFEFLSVLDAVYNDAAFQSLRPELTRRLAASEGGIHPRIEAPSRFGLSELCDWWQHSWSVLWGPPGTGKTWTTGQQISAVLDDPTERILAVSTTNRATDALALSLGDAARVRSSEDLQEGKLLRIGKGASIRNFATADLETMLQSTESEALYKMEDLAEQLQRFETWEEKALTRKKISELRAKVGDRSKRNFVDSQVRVVIATAFRATCFLQDELVLKLLNEGDAPFTTVLIDEAGLMSRTTIAALSMLAARRVVLVGDSKQLAPISRISRVLPSRQQNWMASSGLSHLEDIEETTPAVHVLSEQRRMHSDVCQLVSDFQYGGLLTTAPETQQRQSSLPSSLSNYSRVIWYVLDEEGSDLADIRAERGPGNNSWVRSITGQVLERLFADPAVRQADGLFISPYKAQAQSIVKLLTRWELSTWEASTVHSQQGSEADIVVFDTVNAASYNWPFDEWKRLVNVALSRAREAVIVLASRSEMTEPYLRPLLSKLKPSCLREEEGSFQWQEVPLTPSTKHFGGTVVVAETKGSYEKSKQTSCNLGGQISSRRGMSVVLSKEQQRLTNLSLDGKPRLVRGVAGSGKSLVLCNWLAKTVQRLENDKRARIWAVYANRSLHKLLQDSIESAWKSLLEESLFDQQSFPWEKVSLLHVKDVLAGMLPNLSLSMDAFDFDYDRAAEELLNCQELVDLAPRCSALFIDEAQDMGPSTLKLLLSLVEQVDNEDPNSRSAHVFYDNAQNIYGRKTPKWSEFGLDMRGRSTIMRESFRGTLPIAELAVNVLHRLAPEDQRQDQQELIELGLLEKIERNQQEWLRVRFNEVDGPKPILHLFENRQDEVNAIAGHMRYLTVQESIAPSDICVIYNGKSMVQLLEMQLGPALAEIGVELSVQTNRSFERKENTLIVTTSHSYKGYESEVVFIPGVDQFVTGEGQVLFNNLYVAMTRARSLLALYGVGVGTAAGRQITSTLAACVQTQRTAPIIDADDP